MHRNIFNLSVVHYNSLINNFSAITITGLRSWFSGVYSHGSSALHTLQIRTGHRSQTHLPYVVMHLCGYEHHASGAHHAWIYLLWPINYELQYSVHFTYLTYSPGAMPYFTAHSFMSILCSSSNSSTSTLISIVYNEQEQRVISH